MNRSSLYSAEKAVEAALVLGYQISPDAVKLFRKFSEKNSGKELVGNGRDVGSEFIVRVVIEKKTKSAADSLSISVNDLIDSFPEIFEGLLELETVVSQVGIERANGLEDLEIRKDPTESVQPTGVEGFSQLFRSRYEKIVKILMERPEGRQITKISKLSKEKGEAKVAGLVFSRRQSKNGLEFTLDDDTGNVQIIALKPEVRKSVDEIELDQCVLVDVELAQGKLFAKSVTQPDVPSRVASTSKKTVYAVFLSDLHIGSNKFLGSAFDRFLEWLAGKKRFSEGDDEIIRRLKYIVIGGDVVDGVGVFPNQ